MIDSYSMYLDGNLLQLIWLKMHRFTLTLPIKQQTTTVISMLVYAVFSYVVSNPMFWVIFYYTGWNCKPSSFVILKVWNIPLIFQFCNDSIHLLLQVSVCSFNLILKLVFASPKVKLGLWHHRAKLIVMLCRWLPAAIGKDKNA